MLWKGFSLRYIFICWPWHKYILPMSFHLQIPLFIKGPGVKSGHSLTRPVRNRDILPTAAWALGVKASPFWDGQVMEEPFEN